jgi:hypothetical protein
MHRTPVFVPGLAFLLIACILIAGCSTPDTTAQTTTPDTTTHAGALFGAGDIVRNPAYTTGSAWLVIGYDAASDKYERTPIYPNDDGSWGYRTDNRTETIPRSTMEKLKFAILANMTPSSVPIVTPTVVTPEETTTVTTSVTSTPTPAPTTSEKPYVTGLIPDNGYSGTKVTISDLFGSNFVTGATVSLSRNGSSTITATNVRVVSNKSIICTFDIPAGTPVGAWDVSVRNPDGQSDTYTNIFTVHRDTSVVTTTSPLSAGTLKITYIDPPFAVGPGDKKFEITGSGFKAGASVTLRRTDKTDIVAREVSVNSDTDLICFITIPTNSFGSWDIIITNPDQTFGRLFGGLEVRG